MIHTIHMIIAFLFILLFSACSPQPSVGTEVKTEMPDSTSANPSTDARLSKIKLPPGFKIEIYSDAVPNARAMALSPSGTLYVGTMSEGKVYAIKDKDGDGKAETKWTIASDLNKPVGVAFSNGDLYVSAISR